MPQRQLVTVVKRCVMSGASRIEFGKDLGLMHEVVVTGRKAGATSDFWACLAHDEQMFSRVVELVQGVGAKVEEDFFSFQTTELTLNDLIRQNPELFYQRDDPWWKNEDFASKKGVVSRLQLRTSSVPGSFYQTWVGQQKLLGQDEFVPFVRDVVEGMIAYYQATGKRLFSDYYVRCQDISSLGVRVDVGLFFSLGLSVCGNWGDGRYGGIGLSSARNS